MDVIVYLCLHGNDGSCDFGMARKSFGGMYTGISDTRRIFYIFDTYFGFILGQTDVGGVVGMGCTTDFGVNLIIFIFGIHCVVIIFTGEECWSASGRVVINCRSGKHTDNSFFGGLVEHASSTGDNCKVGSAVDTSGHVAPVAVDGVFIHGILRSGIFDDGIGDVIGAGTGFEMGACGGGKIGYLALGRDTGIM